MTPVSVRRHKESEDIKEIDVVVRQPQCVAVEETVIKMLVYEVAAIVVCLMWFDSVNGMVIIVVNL